MQIRLDQMECGCNAAVSLIAASSYPRINSFGTYYCDANAIGGNYCHELDIMEANKYAFKLTAHKCDDPKNKLN